MNIFKEFLRIECFMKKEELKEYEGEIVCFLHKLSKDDKISCRWSRGVIYKGACYDISLQYKDGKVPSIHLETIKLDYIEQMNALQKSQYSELEQSILDTLLSKDHESSYLKVKVIFYPWREDREKDKEKEDKKKDDEIKKEIEKREKLIRIITQLENEVSHQRPLLN